jgi:hypothetical protein
MATYGKAHFLRDAQSLADYQPRNAAINLINETRIEDFLNWEYVDGRQAAFGQPSATPSQEERLAHLSRSMFLDIELYDRLMKAAPFKSQPPLARKGFESVRDWMASPLEIVLRRGTADGFKRVIRQLTSPEIRFNFPEMHEQIGNAWASAAYLLMAHGEHKWRYKDDVVRKHSLLSLALCLGKLDCADAMARSGICPIGSEQWHEFGLVFRVLYSLPRATLNLVAGQTIDDRTMARATDWIAHKRVASISMEEACEHPGTNKSLIQAAVDKAHAALELAAGFDYLPLARACEWGRPDLLRALFAAGADPNALYKTGISALCRIESKRITPEILAIWLEAGANPRRRGGDEFLAAQGFGTAYSPSALYQWTWAGRIDLVKLACEKGIEPIELVCEYEGRTYAPLLALALQNGHGDLAAWMIEHKGCRLDHLSSDDDVACRQYGQGDALKQANAAEERMKMQSYVPEAKNKKRKITKTL